MCDNSCWKLGSIWNLGYCEAGIITTVSTIFKYRYSLQNPFTCIIGTAVPFSVVHWSRMLRHLARDPINLMVHLGVPGQSFNNNWRSFLTFKTAKGFVETGRTILWSAQFTVYQIVNVKLRTQATNDNYSKVTMESTPISLHQGTGKILRRTGSGQLLCFDSPSSA